MSLLEVKDLKTYFYTDAGCAKAVDGVSFSLDKGKVLGICLLYTSPSPRDYAASRMPSSA